jgi:predicted acetyltransferase
MEEDKLLAFCTLVERDEIVEEETEPDMKPWMGFVYTYPTHRGNRYSEKLIRYACRLAREDGYEKVYLSSNEVGLYEKYGFVYLKRLHTLWGEETQVFEKEVDCSKYEE